MTALKPDYLNKLNNIDSPQSVFHKIQLIGVKSLAFLIPSGIYFLEAPILVFLFLNWAFGVKGYVALKQMPLNFKLLIGFFLLYVLGFFYTTDLSEHSKEMTKHLAYIFLPICLVGLNINQNTVSLIKKVFIVSTILFLLYAISYAFFDVLITGKTTIYLKDSIYSKYTSFGLTRVFKNGHPTYSSFFCSVAVIFSYFEYICKKKYMLGLIFTALLLIFSVILNSITGIFTIALVLILLVNLRLRNRLLKTLFPTLFIVIATSTIIYNPLRLDKIEKLRTYNFQTLSGEKNQNIFNLRATYWKHAIKVFKSSPIFGTSAGDYRKQLVLSYKNSNFKYAAKNNASAHNQFLTTFTSFGLVGGIYFLYLVFYPLIVSKEARMFILVFCLFSLTEDMLLRQQGIFAFAFFYTLLAQNKNKTFRE